MKLYEKIILVLIGVSGGLFSLSSLFKLNLFPFFGLIPFGLFLILLIKYTNQLKEKLFKLLLTGYIVFLIINYFFHIHHWPGQMLLDIIKGFISTSSQSYSLNKL